MRAVVQTAGEREVQMAGANIQGRDRGELTIAKLAVDGSGDLATDAA